VQAAPIQGKPERGARGASGAAGDSHAAVGRVGAGASGQSRTLTDADPSRTPTR